MTTDDRQHLSDAEVSEALRFGLDEDRAGHLAGCRVCQRSVEWNRLARLGVLLDPSWDWAGKVLIAIATAARRRGNGMVHTSAGLLASLPFQYRITKVR